MQFNHSNWLSKEPVQLEGMHKHMECINIVGTGFLIPYFMEIPRLYIAFRPLFPMFPPFSFMCSQQLSWCSGYHYCTTSFNYTTKTIHHHHHHLYYIEWKIHWCQKFSLPSSTMSLLFENYWLVKVIYLLIWFNKLKFFPWNKKEYS